MGVCNCSMFCCMLLYVHSSIAIILMGKRELVALLNLSSWCLVMVERFFLAVPRGCLRFVIVVFPVHTHLLFFFDCAKFDQQKRTRINPFKPNGIYLSYQLDSYKGGIFHFYSNLNTTFCKQTVETLTRRRILICVCTV